MDNFLSFLATAEVEEVKANARVGIKKEVNPNPALLAIRVWKDGSVFPSQALVDLFNLEFQPITYVPVPPKKEGEPAKKQLQYSKTPGNAFDVIDSRVWGQYKAEKPFLFIAPVPRDAGKVDLFGTTTYDEEGKPKTRVMEQGAKTFGEAVLIPAIKEIYGIDLTSDAKDAPEFVDMIVFDTLKIGDKEINISQAFSKPITLVPKRVTRGEQKGTADFVRRENITIWGFAPQQVLNPAPEEKLDKGNENSKLAAGVAEKAPEAVEA